MAIKITDSQLKVMMTVDACEVLFPEGFTLGNVLDVAGSLALRALMRVPKKESRKEITQTFIEGLKQQICELEEEGL